MALGVEVFPRGDMGDLFADLVLDDAAELPEKLKVFYWLYPYWEQVSIRGCGVMVNLGAAHVVVSVLKFTPLAFMVAVEPDKKLNIPHLDLRRYCIGSGMHQARVSLSFKNLPPPRYPEAPGDSGAVMHTTHSYIATRK